MLKNFQSLEQKVTSMKPPKKVAVVKAANNHVLESIFELVKQGIIIPYLIDKETDLKNKIQQMNIKSANYYIIEATTDESAAFKGVELARKKKVDFIMKGYIQTNILLKQVINHDTGIRNSNVLSHFALLDVPDYSKLLGVTDGGMLLTPNVDQKSALIENALKVMNALSCEKPKFAVLSSAEVIQPKVPASIDADKLTKQFELSDKCVVEGPISLDLATDKTAVEEKHYEGNIQGDADVLVASDIVAGNTLSKSMILFGNATMAGLILGAQVPIALTSRSSSAAEKKYSLLLALQTSHANE